MAKRKEFKMPTITKQMMLVAISKSISLCSRDSLGGGCRYPKDSANHCWSCQEELRRAIVKLIRESRRGK